MLSISINRANGFSVASVSVNGKPVASYPAYLNDHKVPTLAQVAADLKPQSFDVQPVAAAVADPVRVLERSTSSGATHYYSAVAVRPYADPVPVAGVSATDWRIERNYKMQFCVVRTTDEGREVLASASGRDSSFKTYAGAVRACKAANQAAAAAAADAVPVATFAERVAAAVADADKAAAPFVPSPLQREQAMQPLIQTLTDMPTDAAKAYVLATFDYHNAAQRMAVELFKLQRFAVRPTNAPEMILDREFCIFVADNGSAENYFSTREGAERFAAANAPQQSVYFIETV